MSAHHFFLTSPRISYLVIGSERLCFWGAPHIFQIKYSVNMSGKVDLLKTWEGTTTLLMWLWPVRMISRWKLTRWSWLGRYSFIDYFTVIITSRSLLRSRQEAAAGRDGQASRAKDSTNLIPIRLLSCWNWTIGLLSSWNWTIKYFSL